ncbi:CAP domain-containing protein [Tropicimonas aquimaris]|uniref:CAP domain-containing protein n=1 Tax=Tropicimonas aquimaris TaxID=914152 RepID=A0ABW3IWA8_9RHOB
MIHRPFTDRKRPLLAFCLISALALSLPVARADAASCTRTAPSGLNQPIDPARIDQNRLNAAIAAEINYIRCTKGRPALATPSSLRKVAVGHSRWMASASRLTHTSNRRGQQTPQQRVVSTGIDLRMGSENIARVSLYRLDEFGRFKIDDAGSCRFSTMDGKRISRHTYGTLARYAAQLWYKSSAHRKNLMDGRARMTGSGAGFDARGGRCGEIYLTQNFAG